MLICFLTFKFSRQQLWGRRPSLRPPHRTSSLRHDPETYDDQIGQCKFWPPRGVSSAEFLGVFVPPTIRDQVWNLKPMNCISIGRKCYCCCAPYRVNPCDAKCTLDPCHNGHAFTTQRILQLREKWLRRSG
ncbi:hypothetical protein L596_023325 [Steinernema carpocapsae]|uniref:Uncharacterized protein n=1 Tax=Steinernema carpocapsae TaxID=34508 RepID=A0A4U5ME28_STECR|nr:hypothetical protein L596_023325 [Steinernema carpocapsae]